MNKICVILRRELGVRLRRPSFWVLTLMVPVVLAVLYSLPVWAAQRGGATATVLVVDETGLFADGFHSTAEVQFSTMPSIDYAKRERSADDLLLYIPMRETAMPREATLFFFGSRPPALSVQSTVDGQLQQLLRTAILEDVYGLSPAERNSVESAHISLHTRDVVTGRDGLTRVKTVVSVVLALLMALAMIVFGVQVVRAVQEERQNRVAEVIATSVRPVQLLGGKVAAVAVAAVVQLLLWGALTAAAIAAVQAAAPDLFEAVRQEAATQHSFAIGQSTAPVMAVDDTVRALAGINLPLLAAMFLVCFLLGYLLYGGLLAALASRLDSEADALQWTLLVCSPLLLVALLTPLIVRGSPFLVLFPFTAPAALIASLPFGVSVPMVLAAMVLLALCGIAALLLAARTYRRRIYRI